MILSMTGFGRGVVSSPKKKITVEIKSLNSKQLDLFMRSPLQFRQLDVELRNSISGVLERGKVELNATVENVGASSDVNLNLQALAAYKAQIENMARVLDIETPTDWYATLMRLPDVLSTSNEEIDEQDIELYKRAVREALEALVSFRTAEGKKLYDFFITKIENIRKLLTEVEPFEKSRVDKIKARLEEQLSQLRGVDYDKGRLEQELIFYIEKLDVSEEKLRLRTHLDYFIETMGAADGQRAESGQGKKLGFIAQEMGREINT
ncbi:MAG: YicC family protein, partial [Muribaculaceae bacterium]|nr:YicC family protein [Muribaculaceae bacterium]